MTAPDLPAELKAALEAKLQGFSRADAASRAALISKTYRDGGGSTAIRSEADALAYALSRMPATYAAVTASLAAMREMMPGFAPASLLDVGAGPGTATWAAAEAFPSLEDLRRSTRMAHCGRWRLISPRRARGCGTSNTSLAPPGQRSPAPPRRTLFWQAI